MPKGTSRRRSCSRSHCSRGSSYSVAAYATQAGRSRGRSAAREEPAGQARRPDPDRNRRIRRGRPCRHLERARRGALRLERGRGDRQAEPDRSGRRARALRRDPGSDPARRAAERGRGDAAGARRLSARAEPLHGATEQDESGRPLRRHRRAQARRTAARPGRGPLSQPGRVAAARHVHRPRRRPRDQRLHEPAGRRHARLADDGLGGRSALLREDHPPR